MGPRIDPWGTPILRMQLHDLDLLIITEKERPSKYYDGNHLSTFPASPKFLSSFSSNVS